MKKRILPFLILSFLITWSYSQTLTPELLWKLGRLSGETISPDRKQVLFGITKYSIDFNRGNRDLYLLSLEDGSMKQISSMDGNEFNETWAPDGQKIGFLSAAGGDVQVWEMNSDGSDPQQITIVTGGVSTFQYSPDGNKILFTKDVKLDPIVKDKYPDLPLADARIIDNMMYRHWNAWSDYSYSHIFYQDRPKMGVAAFSGASKAIDIMEGERFDSPLNPMGGAEQITWSRDGKYIVYTCKKVEGKDWAVSTNSELYRYNLATKKTENLTQGMNGYDVEPSFSPDGSQMAWLSMERGGFESDRNRIFLMDVASGKKQELTVGFDQSAGGLSWSANGQSIYFTSTKDATEQIYRINIKTRTIEKLTEGVHNYVSVMEAGDNLIGSRCSMSAPNELFQINPKTSEQKQLTNINTDILKELKMGNVSQRMVKTSDGKNMLTWVIYPPDFDASRKYPTLLYCQGGPQSAVNQFFSYRWNFQLMAANGYIVVAPNRRGLPGFGQAWNDAISKDWGGQAMRDYLSAIDDVSKESYVDKERRGAVGASYGGYSVYYLAGIHEKRFKAFIAHCGLFNLESWYGSTEEIFFANWDIGGAPWDKPRPPSYDKFSPHNLVGNWDTPMLVIHGEKDFRVPVTEGIQAFNSAQLRGIPSRFLYFPEEGHWVVGPQNGILWHREFFEWLDTYLK